VPTDAEFPVLRQVVLDTTDTRALAEFYRELLGYEYRDGDEPPDDETPEWLVLRQPAGGKRIAFQLVDALPRSTWPTAQVPQQLHLDLTVGSREQFDVQHQRALELGARLLLDRSDDEQEPLRVYADPAGHPFCIFVAP
jgi:catechol 2,3-dioxygenase-like lactoylglutathione lyase family enzyme